MIRLIDQEPVWVRFLPELVCPNMYKREIVASLKEAQGIQFNDPITPTHRVCIPFRGCGVPPDENGGNQWDVSGNSFDDLTLNPSLVLRDWHGWIRKGELISV